MFVLLGNLVNGIISNQNDEISITRSHLYLFKMAAVGIGKSLPLFRHAGVVWRANRYWRVLAVKRNECLKVCSSYSFDAFV